MDIKRVLVSAMAEEMYDDFARRAATEREGSSFLVGVLSGMLDSNDEGILTDEATLAIIRYLVRAYFKHSNKEANRQWRENTQIVTKGHGGRHD